MSLNLDLHNFRRNPDKTQNLLFTDETITIPNNYPYCVRLSEVPDNGSISARPIINNFTELYDIAGNFISPVDISTYQINYGTGDIIFNELNAGQIVVVQYYKKGTLIDATHINFIVDYINTLENEIEMIFAKRIDFFTDDTIYEGEAQVGSLDSDTSWRIREITFSSDGDVEIKWASGTSAFDKIWTNRLTYTYS